MYLPQGCLSRILHQHAEYLFTLWCKRLAFVLQIQQRYTGDAVQYSGQGPRASMATSHSQASQSSGLSFQGTSTSESPFLLLPATANFTCLPLPAAGDECHDFALILWCCSISTKVQALGFKTGAKVRAGNMRLSQTLRQQHLLEADTQSRFPIETKFLSMLQRLGRAP